MFEEQAKRIGNEGPRYILFHYNCWEYDYYEEPLVAIVASILDQIDENLGNLSFIGIDHQIGIHGLIGAYGTERGHLLAVESNDLVHQFL